MDARASPESVMNYLDFDTSLSPEQRVLFEKLHFFNNGTLPTPTVPPPSEPPQPPPAAGEWYTKKAGVATPTEVLVLSMLLVASFSNDFKEIDAWLHDVDKDAARMRSLGTAWHPPPNAEGKWHQKDGTVLPKLRSAVAVYLDTQTGGNGTIATVAAVIAKWPGLGAMQLKPSDIYWYVCRLPTKKHLTGPRYDGGRSAAHRHVSALPQIAALLGERTNRHLMLHLFRENEVVIMHDVTMTKAEMVEEMEVMESQQAEVQCKLTAANKYKSELVAKVTTSTDKRRDAVKHVRDSSKAAESAAKEKAKKEIKAIQDQKKVEVNIIRGCALNDARAEVDEERERKLKRIKELKSEAHADKRGWKERAENAEHLADLRLTENKALKEEKTERELAYDELMLEVVEGAEGQKQLEAWARQQAMPRWHAYRASGRGGGRSFDTNYRVTIYSAIANQVPLSAIGPMIVDIVNRTAPWLEPQAPTRGMLTEARFELRFVEEALAARRVAAAHAIRMLGFDETTKKGNPSITSNVIIEPEEGAKLEPVVLRGAYCSAGGTSEAIAAAIEAKCFSRLRNFLERWKAKFLQMYPNETWTGPEAKDLTMARLAGGGALQSDTCNTAEKAKRLLVEMIGEQARERMGAETWDAMSEEEQTQATRVHELDCWQHMRNIFLKEMSSAQAKHVAEELKPHLDAFTSWERMSTEYTQLLRAAYKEFHHGNDYYKGKGREFHVWLKEHHPTSFAVHFERAEGGRQDLDYDAAVPLYIMRPYMVEYLHSVVFAADHSNVLEDFLYTSFCSEQFIAMTRANALIDLAISRPLRWLAGNSYKLDDWSPISMGRALDLVEQFFVKASVDGSLFLDPTLDIFKEIADEQPLFAEYRKHMYEEHTNVGPDGKTRHHAFQLARDELLTPSDPTNASHAVRRKTIKYLEVQCVAGLRKMHDPKLALHNKLTSQDGGYSFDKAADVHTDTIGLDATNDRLAESVFGVYDYVLKRNPNISMEAASAVAMAMRAKSFSKGGYFHSLPLHEQEALVEVARSSVREMRKIDHADHAQHDAYVTAKRKSNSQLELDALVKQYALALSFFDRWKQRHAVDRDAVEAALAALEQTDKRKQTQEQLNYLRQQIEMRVIGLGFVEFKTPWSSSKDETVGTVADLKQLLIDILWDERAREIDGDLPEVAVVPIMKRKTFKELGTPTVQATTLSNVIKELSPEELLKLAEEERVRLETQGEIDRVGDAQPEKPPPMDDSIIGTQLEICWRYWREPTAEEKAKGEKRKKIGVKMWCEGEVVLVANGTTTTENPENARCKKLPKAGAVRIKWPADLTREVPEPESFTWNILQEATWGKDVHLGWRFTEGELAKRAEAAATAEPARKRRK